MANLTISTETPKLFLTDYASYNQGTQFEFGHWVDLSEFSDAEELQTYIKNHFAEADKKSPLLCGSKREEIMFTDYENLPAGLYSECGIDFNTLFDFFDRCELSYYDIEVIEAFAELGNYDVNDVDSFFDALEESYQGEYESDEDFTQELLESCGDIPINLPNYIHIDWQSTARNIMFDYYESNGHYFRAI